MPANQTTYTDALKKASNAAWDKQWPAAIREYRRALVEFPDDAEAHAGLALALEESGRLEEALNEQLLCVKLAPQDPTCLMHAASLYARLGKAAEATNAYLKLAEMHCAEKEMERAIEAWRQVAAMDANRVDVLSRLVGALKETGQYGAAAQELTVMARVHQQAGERELALRSVEESLLLDPDNIQARSLLSELRGRPASGGGSGSGSAVEQARRSSLARLAQTVFDAGPKWHRPEPGATQAQGTDVQSLVASAIDAQMQGRTGDAIERYEQIIKSGTAPNEVLFNLALLYQATRRFDEAIPLLKQTARERSFGLAANLALGECYRAQGKGDAALESYIQAMKIVDLSTLERDQADDVIRLYESLAEGYRSRGDQADAEGFMQSLVDFLGSRGWEDKVSQVRQHIETVAQAGTPMNLAEVLETRETGRVIEILKQSSAQMEQGLLGAASDEALEAIEIAPGYIPAHVQLAEILERGQRLPEAREKYETLAEVAAVRGDFPKAVTFCRRALRLAPEDVTRRSKLIDLLVRQGQVSEALAEYVELGAVLERSGHVDKALDRYGEALRLAGRAGVSNSAVAALRMRLAEGHLKAGEWSDALPLVRELSSGAPSDERLHFILSELYFRLGQREKGERELDLLLGLCGGVASTTSRQVLAAMLRNLPDEVPVNLRLARTLGQAGERAKAVQLLDALGDRLLNAGQREDALAVVQEIIALDPPEVQEYKKLLNDLAGNG